MPCGVCRVAGPVRLEPPPDDESTGEPRNGDPAARYLRRESVELAFVAALQHLRGREDVGRFVAERVSATPWRLVPLRVNGQLGFACYALASGRRRVRTRPG